MTQEEKARAYDEAKERMRAFLKEWEDCGANGEAMEKARSVFPELAESEDERIRKHIIDIIKDNAKSKCIPCDAEIAYLEKQKEYELTEEDKKIIPEALVMLCNDIINHRVHTPIKTDEEGARKIKAFLKTFNRRPYKTREEWEKQKEQKPAEWSDYKDKVNVPYCSSEPEWSEEDEKQIAQIERIVKNAGCTKMLQEKIHNWFKSIRPSWKPSEQEKGALRTAISVLTEERNFPKAVSHLQSILDAFDGKETRKDWKPSEEQISALNYFIKLWGNSDDQLEYTQIFITVKSLYEQLKKLM